MAGSFSIHQPLKTPTSIRLLQVGQRGSEEATAYKLVTSSVKRARDRYYALSYTWGEPGDEGIITVNGQTMTIRKNLFSFLQQLQRTDWTGLLWVDALCIDQSDIPERNHQVRLMRDIYAAARRVFVWLGPSSAAVDHLFDRCRADGRGLSLRGLNDDVISHGDLAALLEIVRRPYWTRIWIVQEIWVGRRVVLWCGENILDFAQMKRLVCEDWALGIFHQEDFIHDVLLKYADSSWQRSDLIKWSFIAHLFWEYQANPIKSPHRELSELIYTFGHMECEDRHDRIYAVLGLSTCSEGVGHNQPLKVEYSEPLAKLLVRTLDFCQRNSESADLSTAIDLALFLDPAQDQIEMHQDLLVNVYQPLAGAVSSDFKSAESHILIPQDVIHWRAYSAIENWIRSPTLVFCHVSGDEKAVLDLSKIRAGDNLYPISPAMASIDPALRPADSDDLILAVRQDNHGTRLIDVGIFPRIYIDDVYSDDEKPAYQIQKLKLLQWRQVMEEHLRSAQFSTAAADEALHITMDLGHCLKLAEALQEAANWWKDNPQ